MQSDPSRIDPKYFLPTKFLLEKKKKNWHYNGSKRDFSKNRDRKYHNAVHQIILTQQILQIGIG
jgi:hypothetical protein